MALTIKPVTAADIEDLTALGRATCIESYEQECLGDPIYLQNHLEKNYTIQAIEREFYIETHHFFIARIDTQAVGFCKLALNEHEDNPHLKDYRCIELAQMYVLKAFQGKHIGHALLGESLKFASQHGFEIIWLGSLAENERSIKIYEQWGFVYFDTHFFDYGGIMQTDVMMKRPVKLHEKVRIQK